MLGKKMAMALAMICSYSMDIPAFLHNRPTEFVQHCLKRLPATVNIQANAVCELGHGIFAVANESSEHTYDVYVTSTETVTAPWCYYCRDWARRHVPCKHLLVVLMRCLQWSWQHLHHGTQPSHCLTAGLCANILRQHNFTH